VCASALRRPLPEPDARRPVASLIADGHADALSAAAVITKALKMQLAAVALTLEQRAAILAQLDEAETPGLAELRGRLYSDARKRRPY
jgi:hypothetical protein